MPAPPENLDVTIRNDVYPGIDPKHHYDARTFTGKVVLVTGASRGIGTEIALSFARSGASLVLVARSQANLDAVKEKISLESPVPVLTIAVDVVQTKQVQAAVQAAIAKFGRLDIVVANAGKSDTWDKPFTQNDPDEWWKTVEVNIRGVYNVAHFTLPYLDSTKGYFVIVTSGAAQLRIPFASNYCMSKHAVLRFNELITLEHPDVKSFAIHPGGIKTDLANLNPAWEAMMVDTLRLPACTILRLTSGRDDYLSGRFVSSNWDLDAVEKKHKAEIIDQEALVSRLAIPH